MARKAYCLNESEARTFNRMARDWRRQGPPKARRKPRRRSRSNGGGGTIDILGAHGAAWTSCEYDPTTGAILNTYYRGTSRTNQHSFDADIMMTSTGKLFANGWSSIGADDGIGALYDPDTKEIVWLSDNNGLSAVTNLITYATATPSIKSGRHVLEADDGFLWLSGTGSVARINATTGVLTHRVPLLGGATGWLYPCPTSGSVVSRPGTTGGSDRIGIFDDTGTQTHGWSTHIPVDMAEAEGVLVTIESLGNPYALDATDLSTISTGAVTGTKVSVATDGTTAWFLCDEATDKIRAHAVSAIGTELWNGNSPTVTGNAFLLYNPLNSHLYQFSGTTLKKLDVTDGTTVATPVWTSPSLTGSSYRHWVAFGTDFVVISVRNEDTANVFCLDDSDGTIRWSDYNGRLTDLGGNTWQMYSLGVHVTATDRIFVAHGYKQQ